MVSRMVSITARSASCNKLFVIGVPITSIIKFFNYTSFLTRTSMGSAHCPVGVNI